MVKEVSSKLIATKFAMRGYNVHPSVIEILKKEDETNIDSIVKEVCKIAEGSFIITPEELLPVLESYKIKSNTSGSSSNSGYVSDSSIISGSDSKNNTENLVLKGKGNQKYPKHQKEENFGERGNINLLKDITGTSACIGDVDDFVMFFNSRYDKVASILRQRIPAVNIAEVKRIQSEKVTVTGMITSVRESMNGNAIIELEDKTGRMIAIGTGKLKQEAEELLGDEIIAVEGFLRGKNLIAERIIYPDIPMNGKKRGKNFHIAFISDTHFGSNTFLHDEWGTFVKWLNCEIGNEKSVQMAENVKYLVIAGDIVDGVGIYPDQDKELDILDVYQQYEEAASQLELIQDLKIILGPGNHDAVRQAEPQPALPKEIADLFPKSVMHVGNPSLIDIEGVKLLIYHGRSIDDMVPKIPRIEYERPHLAMIEMLKRRHLAPVYGNRTLFAPEREDYLVIDDVPDILHCGHVHTYGTAFYRGVFLVNSSCWQSQTEFQKKVNLNPVPGNVAVYRPGGEPVRLNFFSS